MSNMATLVSDLQTVLKALGLAMAAGLRVDFLSRLINDPAYRARFVEAEARDFELSVAKTDQPIPAPVLEPRDFPVWKTIQLGRHKNVDGYRRAIKAAGMKISQWGNDILGKTPLAPELVDIDLIRVSGKDLGFTRQTRRDEIYRRGLELGLELCPPEAGPALREQYSDLPAGEWHLIAMEPIADSGGNLGVFRVERDGDGRWLDARNGDPDRGWRPEVVWVFSRTKR